MKCQRFKTSANIHCTWLLYLILTSTCRGKTLFGFVQNVPSLPPAALQDDSSTASTTMPTTTAVATTTSTPAMSNRDISIGPCKWVIGRQCPDSDVKFYIYTRSNSVDRQCLHIDASLEQSNLTSSFFDPRHATKIIIHGYNSDMFLHPLQKMREEYLARDDHNIIYVDWSVLSPGPCYVSAVHNTRHVGACAAQLVERLLDTGNKDIHVIGFSLGAQLPNYIARSLGEYKLPRITGLDPALPLFITAGINDKLDASDAEFVDVIHTNALVQGKLERCGHADFYMNGGIRQPGCNGQGLNSFACSHQRAPAYFLESIRSPKGFWGWSCSGYIPYLLGMCPPTNYLLEAGDNIRRSTRGMFFVITNETSPYALGKWTDLPTLGANLKHKRPQLLLPMRFSVDPLLQHIDQFGKLAANFNNLPAAPYPTVDPYEQWTNYFNQTNNEDKEEEDDSLEEHDFVDFVDTGEPLFGRQISTGAPALNWREYKRNLTEGFIENGIFNMPSMD